MFLSVPVPTDNNKVQVVTWVDYTNEEISYTRYGVKIGKEDNIFKLKNLLKKQIGITCPVRHMVKFKNDFFAIFVVFFYYK